jgi:tRNA U34 5-methylaminomethyl-2-thiouridine-forming methyltransferase MnmC
MPSEFSNPASLNGQELLWLKTRDGSPTLWSNELGESFRSLRGAFTESYWAFVRPALERATEHLGNPFATLEIGEFGLGVGTNWLLWSLFAKARQIPFRYSALEKERLHFDLGLEKWKDEISILQTFMAKFEIELSVPQILEVLENPQIQIYASMDEMLLSNARFDIWFHDPFGAEVNPEGYTPTTLEKLSAHWNPQVFGVSYACNRGFQDGLRMLGMEVIVKDFEEPIGKRSRLEFQKAKVPAKF